MGKFCTNCGHELRDGDKFCSNCAAAVGGQVPAPAVQLEYCEIKWRSHGFWLVHDSFYGEIRGPRGLSGALTQQYVGSLVDPHGPLQNGKNKRAVEGLVRELASQGWEPLAEHGPQWYNYKFRRQVRG